MSFVVVTLLLLGLLGVGLAASGLGIYARRRSLLRLFIGLTLVLYVANGWVFALQGWTECDRADCGPWYPIFRDAGIALLYLFLALVTAGLAWTITEWSRHVGPR